MSNNVFIDLTEELYNKGWTVHWEFNIDPALLKYNNCTTYTECRTVDANVATDVDENGVWNYRLDNLEVGGVYDEESGTVDGLFMIDTYTSNTSLVSFNVDLPNLTKAISMFNRCEKLTSWNIDLPKLTDGKNMFLSCGALTSFSGNLSSLTIGQNMFAFCDNLTSFSSDLSSLTSGYAMFGNSTYNCTRLDLASVQNIANTINTVSSGEIYIGIQKSLQDTANLETALAAIRAKGWTVVEMYA